MPVSTRGMVNKRKREEPEQDKKTGPANMDLTGKFKILPKSCIESACHIIQSIAENKYTPWKNEGTSITRTAVWAVFGNKMICVSNGSDLPSKFTGVTEYSEFKDKIMEKPIGRGFILANSHTKDAMSNMHLGAILKVNDGDYHFSDISEVEGEAVRNILVTPKSILVAQADGLVDKLKKVGYKAKKFVPGLLIHEQDPGFSEIKAQFSSKQIFAEDEPKAKKARA
ncbi:hypothetical protein FNU76_19195 [Chitinimonas arctica]|uniref:Uncharacterized protein n=1 Tax=Chitinimonas arctica TaxID=2594795 RepID=A0A516SJI7_9NEIS|nr:hypothetical protein [Chitinimonas arctica]QDQ28304.1 hypothetical protein FNU76_19195 [Chitinimonas arctica]